MERCREHPRSVDRWWSGKPLPSAGILKELGGQPCASCGARYYYLVLCVSARGHGATLAARCSRCHEPKRCLSEDRLVQDVEETARLPPAGSVGSKKE